MDPRTPDSGKSIKRTAGLTLLLSFAVPVVLLGLGLVLGWREPAVWVMAAAMVAVSLADWYFPHSVQRTTYGTPGCRTSGAADISTTSAAHDPAHGRPPAHPGR